MRGHSFSRGAGAYFLGALHHNPSYFDNQGNGGWIVLGRHWVHGCILYQPDNFISRRFMKTMCRQLEGNDDDDHHHDVSGDLLFAFSSALASLSSPVCRISKWCTRCYHRDYHHCDAMVMVMGRRFMMYLMFMEFIVILIVG